MTEPNEPDPTPPVHPVPPVDVPPVAVVPVVDPPPPPVDPPPATDPAPTPPAGDPAAPKSTDWREPPWFPPRDKDRRERKSSMVAIVVGLVILAVGVYYFIDRTLGVTMPRIQWGSLWPVVLIVLGGVVLLRSIDRR
jgi:uncharacterized membrane protein